MTSLHFSSLNINIHIFHYRNINELEIIFKPVSLFNVSNAGDRLVSLFEFQVENL